LSLKTLSLRTIPQDGVAIRLESLRFFDMLCVKTAFKGRIPTSLRLARLAASTVCPSLSFAQTVRLRKFQPAFLCHRQRRSGILGMTNYRLLCTAINQCHIRLMFYIITQANKKITI